MDKEEIRAVIISVICDLIRFSADPEEIIEALQEEAEDLQCVDRVIH